MTCLTMKVREERNAVEFADHVARLIVRKTVRPDILGCMETGGVPPHLQAPLQGRGLEMIIRKPTVRQTGGFRFARCQGGTLE